MDNVSVLPYSYVGSNPAVIAPFLCELFEYFERNQIVWAVMHGGETLPHYTRRDVDFLFAKSQIKLVKKIILETAGRYGWVCYAKFRFSALHSLWFILPGEGDIPSAYLQLDCFVDASLRGFSFYREGCNAVFSRKYKSNNGVWCLNECDASALVVLKEILANGRIERESRQDEIASVYRKSPEDFLKAMLAFRLKHGTAKEICAHISKCEWLELKDVAQRAKSEIYVIRFKDVLSVCRYLYDLGKMFFFPFLRLMIVIVGPDGCGKTSVADAINKRFQYRPFFAFMRIHGNFGLFPRLRDIWKCMAGLAGKRIEYNPDPAPATRHMGMAKPLSRFRSMFYIAYYGIEYLVGRLRLRKWRVNGGMVIADRYFSDYFYMRGHMNCPLWWKKIFEKLAPSPDLIFALERPACDIYSQKPELTIEEIEREQLVIREYLKDKKSARIIDASNGLDATVNAVANEIEKWLLEKAR